MNPFIEGVHKITALSSRGLFFAASTEPDILHYPLSQYTRSPLWRGSTVTGSGDCIPRNPRENGANLLRIIPTFTANILTVISR